LSAQILQTLDDPSLLAESHLHEYRFFAFRIHGHLPPKNQVAAGIQQAVGHAGSDRWIPEDFKKT
jgi:hypothetical protein